MNKWLLLSLPIMLTSCATTRDRERTAVDTKLEKALAGKVAGKPQTCLSVINARDSQTFDNGTILYKAGRNLSYRNDLNGCSQLSWNAYPVFDIRGSQICRGDIVRIVDRGGAGVMGACSVGDFVPYRTPG